MEGCGHVGRIVVGMWVSDRQARQVMNGKNPNVNPLDSLPSDIHPWGGRVRPFPLARAPFAWLFRSGYAWYQRGAVSTCL